MPYATPADYVQAFGLREAAMLLQDEEHTLDEAVLQAGLAAVAAGQAVADDAAKAAIARLQTALANTSNYMDGYLRAAVSLPIADSTTELLGTLQDCCLAIARYQLCDDDENASDRIEKAADKWRAWLKDVATQKVLLVTPSGADVPSTGGGRVVIGQPKPAFDWPAVQGFGGGFRS